MRGIHDGPDLTTWPESKPDPKRGRALLIVVVVLALACGVYAGVQDGPEGVDPLGVTHGSVFGDVVTVGPDGVYPNTGIGDASMTCSTEQQTACERKCQDAARPGEVVYSSKCEKRLQPTGMSGFPGLVIWTCECTWVKSPVSAAR